jgi:hypothetical protein
MTKKLAVSYFTDPLCVWALVAQAKLERLLSEMGAHVEVDYRIVPVFGSVPWRFEHGPWAKDGVEGRIASTRRIAEQAGRTDVSGECWRVMPASSWAPSAAIKAVFALPEGEGAQRRPVVPARPPRGVLRPREEHRPPRRAARGGGRPRHPPRADRSAPRRRLGHRDGCGKTRTRRTASRSRAPRRSSSTVGARCSTETSRSVCSTPRARSSCEGSSGRLGLLNGVPTRTPARTRSVLVVVDRRCPFGPRFERGYVP